MNDNKANASGTRVLNKKYKIGECVLKSVTGDVFAVQDLTKDSSESSSLFIKYLPLSYPRSNRALDIFSQEAERVKAHCQSFKVLSFEQDDDAAYLVVQLPKGQFLSDRLFPERVYGDLPTVLGCIAKLQTALRQLNACGIAHGLVGVDSIYITDNGNVALLDSVYVAAQHRQLETESENNATVPNREAIYASPDACFGRAISEQDDVFSLACICYHLLSGQHPFGGSNSVSALLNKMRPQRIEGLNDSQWLNLEQGMSLSTEHRFATLDDFIRGFNATTAVKPKRIASNKKETREASQIARNIIRDQAKNNVVARGSRTRVNPVSHKQIRNSTPYWDLQQMDFPEWLWIPLTLMIGFISGMVLMGLAIKIGGVDTAWLTNTLRVLF